MRENEELWELTKEYSHRTGVRIPADDFDWNGRDSHPAALAD
jgi:hypothetical protein